MLSPVQLRTVWHVAQLGSLHAAAKVLSYTPSALSQQLSLLEKQLGVKLFDRSNNATIPTYAGEQLAVLSEQILGNLEYAENQLRKIALGNAGSIQVASFPTGTVNILALALTDYVDSFPEINLSVMEGEPTETLQALACYKADLILIYEYSLVPKPLSQGLRQIPLIEEDMMYLSAGTRQESVGRSLDLRRMPSSPTKKWITQREGTSGAENFDRICGVVGFVPNIVFRSNNYDAVVELVAHGLGSAILPALGVSDHPKVASAVLEFPYARRRTSLVYRINDRSKLLQPVIDKIVGASQRVSHPGVRILA